MHIFPQMHISVGPWAHLVCAFIEKRNCTEQLVVKSFEMNKKKKLDSALGLQFCKHKDI